MERIIDRFDAYMASAGLNDNKVTVQLGLTVGLIGKSRKPGRDLSRAAITKILDYYSDLNSTWLLTGEGSMLNDSPVSLPDPEPVASGSPSLERLLVMLEETQRMNAMLLGMVKEKDIIIKDLTAEILKIKSKGAYAENVIGSFAADAV